MAMAISVDAVSVLCDLEVGFGQGCVSISMGVAGVCMGSVGSVRGMQRPVSSCLEWVVDRGCIAFVGGRMCVGMLMLVRL